MSIAGTTGKGVKVYYGATSTPTTSAGEIIEPVPSPGFTNPKVDFTDSDSDVMLNVPGQILELDDVPITLAFTKAEYAALEALAAAGTVQYWKIEFSNTTTPNNKGGKWQGQAWIHKLGGSIPYNGRVTATLTLCCTEKFTFTAAS